MLGYGCVKELNCRDNYQQAPKKKTQRTLCLQNNMMNKSEKLPLFNFIHFQPPSSLQTVCSIRNITLPLFAFCFTLQGIQRVCRLSLCVLLIMYGYGLHFAANLHLFYDNPPLVSPFLCFIPTTSSFYLKLQMRFEWETIFPGVDEWVVESYRRLLLCF